MHTMLAYLSLAGPVLLLGCLLLPDSRVRLLKAIGISLPWVVLGGSLLAALGLIITGGPLTLKASFSATGPWSDLSFVLLDRLSATLLLLVSFLGAIISRFSRNYMHGEPREGHFYKWLCITLGSVLCVILSGNLLLFTMAWMATSLSLHHLLLFYREREAAQLAARKKFIISRIGDLCLISAVVWVGVTFGSLDFPTLFEQAAALAEGSLEVPASNLHVIGLLLALGALLKSAQFPFHTWLPDTLETPTPVSALMHAGIINAGGYLIVRLSPLVVLSSPALSTLAIIGAFTAVFAGLIMLTQTSVKKTLAFSTVAQMGFMMLQCGLGAFSLAVLHIVAHSLYKAHAFLSSGELPTARPAARPPSALLLVGTLAFGAAAFVGVHQLLGGFPTGTVYVWVLGLVVVIGLAHFLLHCLGEEGLAPLRWQTGAQAAATVIGLCALYGLLHIGSRTLLGESVAPPPGVQSTAQATVLVVSAGLFALGFALPLCALRFPDQPLLRRIRSHASHGFYCNTLANRLFQIQEIAPSFAKPAYRPSHPAPHPVADETIEEACAKIAPLWPLQHFVAVNPYLGYADKDFAEAARELNRVADANAVPDLATFREVLTKDEAITDADIEGALADAGDSLRQSLKQSRIALSPEAIRAAALDPVEPRGSACQFETFAGFVDHESNGYWQRFVTEDISRHCAAYFDRGQAIWPASIADPSFYQAWHTRMADDFNPDIAGLPGFRKAVEGLPASPGEAIRWALAVLQVPAACTVDFLHAELFSLRGWAGYCQYLRHDAALTGGRDDRIVDLLAVRLVYDAFLFQSKANHRIAAKWATLLDSAVRTEAAPIAPELALRCVLQDAWERSRRRPLFDRIIRQASSRENSEIKPPRRPTLQAVFCIDVRSEIYRRALEAQSPGIETFGFAGFFGLPVRYRASEREPATARCPVLLAPAVEVTPGSVVAHPSRHALAWRAFQKDAPACFPFVETIGMGYSWKTLRASFPQTTADSRLAATPAPAVDFDPPSRVTAAATILGHLGLRDRFGEYVLFAGHGSRSANNPHASGYDCGACGGHAGDVNARIAAALFNDPQVRAGLAETHGIRIPDDTRFLAGLHNTTTDELSVFDDDLPDDRAPSALGEVRRWLAAASRTSRRLRAPLLGLGDRSDPERAVPARSVDWSQTRPEWGLAGNYAFVAAPRERTRALDLDGRVFLHNYDSAKDPEGKTLELILTAPVVVASWINLQYYGSTVDNAHFGSGSKTIHNISAGLGVLAGNGGDLQTGLPVQALAAPDRPIHEALRLHVCLEASTEAIDAVLAKHASVRDLVEHRWIHLFALVEHGTKLVQRKAKGGWAPVQNGARLARADQERAKSASARDRA